MLTMLEFLGGAVVFLFGLAVVAGMVIYVGGKIVHHVPALRYVRFEKQAIRRATPFRLRWLGLASGRRARTRSREQRAGRVQNLLALLGTALGMVLCILAGLSLMGIALGGELGDGVEPWIEIGMFAGGAYFGGWGALKLLRRFRLLRAQRRRILAATASEVRAADPRPPIVMLRAFEDDGRQVHVFEEGAVPVSLEDALVGPLVKRGPVVAVGQPGERLPPIGAGREYISGDWKERVRQLLDEAGVIVVLLHKTPGLLWEIEQIFTIGREERLIFVVPDVKPAELKERWKAVRQTIEACRPELDDDRLSISLRGALAVVFDARAQPCRILGWSRYREYYRDAVEHALWFLGANESVRKMDR
jgi:hypothetical protein